MVTELHFFCYFFIKQKRKRKGEAKENDKIGKMKKEIRCLRRNKKGAEAPLITDP
jgi:hypothetical protein